MHDQIPIKNGNKTLLRVHTHLENSRNSQLE